MTGRAGRWGWSFAAAIAAHGPLAIGIAARAPAPREETGAIEALVFVESVPTTATPTATPTPTATATPTATPTPSATPTATPNATATATATLAPTAVIAAESTWSLTLVRDPVRHLDLPASTAYVPPPAPSNERAPASTSAENALRAALDDKDRELGLGAEGPLVAAIHDVALASRIPVESSAVLTALTDGDGNVVRADATHATGDTRAWDDVATGLVDAMRGKLVRVPSGTRGLRFSFRVEARRRLAAGHASSPTVRLGTPLYRCMEACTASGNVDPTDAVLNAAADAPRTIAVHPIGRERIR